MRPAFHRGALFTPPVVAAIVLMAWLHKAKGLPRIAVEALFAAEWPVEIPKESCRTRQ